MIPIILTAILAASALAGRLLRPRLHVYEVSGVWYVCVRSVTGERTYVRMRDQRKTGDFTFDTWCGDWICRDTGRHLGDGASLRADGIIRVREVEAKLLAAESREETKGDAYARLLMSSVQLGRAIREPRRPSSTGTGNADPS